MSVHRNRFGIYDAFVLVGDSQLRQPVGYTAAHCVAGIHLAYMGVGDFHVGGDRFQVIPVEITAHSMFLVDEVRTELGCGKRRTLCRTNGVAAGAADGRENLVSYPFAEGFCFGLAGKEDQAI